MEFSQFIGHDGAKLGLILNAIDSRCGGVLFIGEKGSGKTTLSRLFKRLLPKETPFVELPLNITEDTLLGGIDIEETLKTGRRILQPGILLRANRGIIYIDDINLLPEEIVSLILEVQSRGEVIIEREGVAKRQPAQFIIIASMNLEEGLISPHLLDRFGMCVLWERLTDISQRIEIMKLAFKDNTIFIDNNSDSELRVKIDKAKTFLPKVILPEQIIDYITRLCTQYFIPGHRGDIYLTYASRAYAAHHNREVVTKEDVDAVVPLVLTHRKKALQDMELEPHEQKPKESQKQHDEAPEEENKMQPPEDKDTREDRNTEDHKEQSNNQSRESLPKEEVFDIGNVFKTKRLFSRKDRVIRSTSGRRTRTKTKDKSGRYVKSTLRGRRDIAIDATLRASAPYQKLRNRKDMLIIHDEDLRYKQRERRMGHLVIFVVDGSGSMGVQRRMTETKGAIQSLLLDCYQKRDMVSMILFRKDTAEVILPPTSSQEMASRLLAEIPVGGRTPLSAGLLMAYKLIKNTKLKNPLMRFLVVLVSDGRANQSLSGRPVSEEIKELVDLLRNMNSTDYIVVDTEDKSKFLKTDLAFDIAMMLDADYYTINNLKAEYLTEIVSSKKMQLESLNVNK